ncbi:hypothetical protein ABLO16_05775 [Mycobacterium tuberculosis]
MRERVFNLNQEGKARCFRIYRETLSAFLFFFFFFFCPSRKARCFRILQWVNFRVFRALHGRTAKLYRRAGRDIALSLPQREYELAGRLMAAAIVLSATTGEPTVEVLNRIAHDYGQAMGAAATTRPPADPAAALELTLDVLRKYGYEPRRPAGPGDDEVELVNCPFHALAREQTELACNMNHALITGVADALAPHSPAVRLAPGPARCCVVLKRCSAHDPE